MTTLKSDLRHKYLTEIDAIQRSVASDPETWNNLEDSMTQIAKLNQLLQHTDDLTLGPRQDQNTKPNADLVQEICCPICFEEMVSPKLILCCTNGHAICSDCDKQVQSCPSCRECFVKNGRPKRNKFAERLISLYLDSVKK